MPMKDIVIMLRYKNHNGKVWSKHVSKHFGEVFEGLEGTPLDRKRWLQLLKGIADYAASLPTSKWGYAECHKNATDSIRFYKNL